MIAYIGGSIILYLFIGVWIVGIALVIRENVRSGDDESYNREDKETTR